MHLVGMITLLILLSLGSGHPIPGARISHQHSRPLNGQNSVNVYRRALNSIPRRETYIIEYGESRSELLASRDGVQRSGCEERVACGGVELRRAIT
jgi:hypothetical protein